MATFNNAESGSSVRTKINNVLQHADGTASELVINDAGADVNFRVESDTDANALFVDGGTGAVGIGTGAPSGLGLHIRASLSSGTPTGTLIVEQASIPTIGIMGAAGQLNRIMFGDPDSNAVGRIIYDHATDSMQLVTSSSERLRITSTGDVLINRTVAPTASTGTTGTLQLGATSQINGRVSGSGLYLTDNIQFSGDPSSTFANATYIASTLASGYFQSAGTHRFHTAAFGTAGAATTALERMRITNEGNVGIGTTSPATGTALDVVSTGTRGIKVTRTATSPSNGTYALEVDNSAQTGNVTAAGALNVTNNNGSGLSIDGKGDVSLYDDSGVVKLFWDASAESLGIGTTAPTNLLDVNADSIRVRTAQTPATAGAAGNQGEIAWDADYIYVCVATNTWKRVAIATW